MDLDENND
ncbi:Protein of unknown function [Lactobacillus acidophilus DSM 20079 = JCM 1132 = NBRC 13951 = CIP 76.13]|nr:Protein of unknown function [Lactobacillus acidophilus DSM 20079 = JCM 1132 = NBRC 13951 = CIP 76.13]CDF71975.1 Protein of unknown function [Lactobacillus acidophilus CIRM-BIA 445]CDF75801.1 Protein of unknown function [Lactobacillus acidophilus DSM 20242]